MSLLLLIDGHSQFYRAIFSPGPRLTAPGTGEPTNGTYYFTRMLLALLREKKPQYIACAADGDRRDLERRRLYAGYKASRDRPGVPDPGIKQQIGRMVEITKALGIPVIYSKGWEADDVIATLARRFRRLVDRVEIVSRDHDLHQLVSNQHRVCLYDPQNDSYTQEIDVLREWGVPPKQVLEIKTLTGDSGDCVPGVGGVGPKRALELIKRFGSAQGVLESAALLPAGIRTAMLRCDLERSRALVRLNAHAPLEPDPDDVERLSFSKPDFVRASPIFGALGFRRLSIIGT